MEKRRLYFFNLAPLDVFLSFGKILPTDKRDLFTCPAFYTRLFCCCGEFFMSSCCDPCEGQGIKAKRILLKISGEGFCPEHQRGISMDSVNSLARQIVKIARLGVQVAVVMGGGNILRGAQFKATDGASTVQEATAHYQQQKHT